MVGLPNPPPILLRPLFVLSVRLTAVTVFEAVSIVTVPVTVPTPGPPPWTVGSKFKFTS